MIIIARWNPQFVFCLVVGEATIEFNIIEDALKYACQSNSCRLIVFKKSIEKIPNAFKKAVWGGTVTQIIIRQ